MKKILSSIFVIIFIVSSSAAIFAAQPARTAEEEYIPIPPKKETKTYHIKIKAVDSAGKPLSGFMGRISIKNRYSKLEFITLPQGDVKLDSNGTMRVPFEIRQPAEGDWTFLENIPMEVTFVVDIFKKGSLTQSKKKFEKTFKLGMFLIHGRTVGPTKDDIFAFEPRYEDAPPIINDTKLYKLYHIASSIAVESKSGDKREGEFFVLARIPQESKLNNYIMPKIIHLYWNKSTKAGLKYPIRVRPVPEDLSKDIIYDHKTIREKIGQTIELGDIDILSKLEHYKRLRAYVNDFIKDMPFKTDYRNKMLANVKSLRIVGDHGSSVPNYVPPPLYDPTYSGTMSIPGDPAEYLAINPLAMFDTDAKEDPVYTIVFHEIGHMLHIRLVESFLVNQFSYFYKGLKSFTSDHETWKPPKAVIKPKYFTFNIGQQYVSFNEATADFFAYLLFNFLETKHPELKKSIYFNRLYLNDFDSNEKADAVMHRGGCIIEGVQTTFLRSLYSANLKQNPTAVFADYLRTMMLNITEKLNHHPYVLDSENFNVKMFPTRTMKDWVLTKKFKKGIIRVGDTVGLARRFNILPCNEGLEIVAFQGSTSKTSIMINGTPAPVDPVLGVIIGLGDKITVAKGLLMVTIVDSKRAESKNIYAPEGASFTLTAHDEIEVHKGAVGISGKIRIKPAGTDVTITPTGTVVFVEVTPDGSTKVQVLEGSVSISTPEGKTDVNEGKAVSVDRGGQVTPAEPVAMTPVDKSNEIFEVSGTSSEKPDEHAPSKKPEEQAPSGEPATASETAKPDEQKPAGGPATASKAALLNFNFMDKPDGDTVKDLSDNGNDGKIHGAKWIPGRGLLLDGTDDYVEVLNSKSINPRAITVIGRITPMSFGNRQWHNIYYKGNKPDCTKNCENRQYTLWLNKSGYLHFTSTPEDRVGIGQLFLNTKAGSVSAGFVFATVIDSSAGTMKTYINGKEAASAKYSTSEIRKSGGNLTIGGTLLQKSGLFNGYIKNFRIYGEALSAAKISEISSSLSKNDTLVLSDIFHPDYAVLKGSWADLSSLKDNDKFKKYDWSKIKKGLNIENGLFATPGSTAQTEAIYYHDGSKLMLKGHATVIDCLDYCGRSGSIEFIIKSDGDKVLWESGLLKQGSPGRDFSVSLEGVKELRLISTDGGNGINEDWGLWANLSLIKVESAPPPASDGKAQESYLPGFEGSISIITYSNPNEGLRVRDEFTTETGNIFIKADFYGLTSDLFVKFKVYDNGTRADIHEIPVFVGKGDSTKVFKLKSPISGWTPGSYNVTALDGSGKVISKIVFVIIKK